MIFTDLEVVKEGSARILNFRHNEELIPGSDQFNHDKDRRNVFSDRTKKKFTSYENIWTLEKVEGINFFRAFLCTI